MHLRRANTEQLRVGQIAGDGLARNVCRGFRGKREKILARERLADALGGRRITEQMIEVAADGVEGVGPGVATVGCEALQNRDGRRIASFVEAIFERAADT